VQVRYLHNPHQRTVEGAEPGTLLAATAQAPLRCTLSHAAADSSLRALAWWRNATAPGADRGALYRHAAAADNAAVLTEVQNATGEPLRMWMDLGGRTETVEVQPGSQRLMEPLVRPVERPGSAAQSGASRPPAMLMSITLQSLELKVRHLQPLQACEKSVHTSLCNMILLAPHPLAMVVRAATRHVL
jgi:hypothetical protein